MRPNEWVMFLSRCFALQYLVVKSDADAQCVAEFPIVMNLSFIHKKVS